jgi:hypothetical protein
VSIDPLLLFSIQFTFALVAYALAARWYVWPRINPLPPAVALVPLVWVHVFRFIGGSILAPGSVGPGVPAEFREMIGYGDMVTAALALTALIALRAWGGRAIWFVWVFVVVGLLDTANAVVQSMRYSVFDYPLGVNWVIVTAYVPALLVSSYLIIVELLRARRAASSTSATF